ncbi:MAG: flagellar basal body rod protein FlgC [Alphaproteobacteria bacterium]|nr:flagellar basal body rod protein FlgC [Alphaproteobacteria bacterium]
MKFGQTLGIASSAMSAESRRMRVIAENLANAGTVNSAGEDPYRRKVTIFETVVARHGGGTYVRVSDIVEDDSDPIKKYEPSHPKADAQGYVLYPNVSPLIEMVDLREAEKSYKANLQVIESAKRILRSALDIMR